MNEEIKRDRSPNHPKMPLEQAINLVAGLHKKAGRSQIKTEVAASALGYGGLNGAALTTIGALNQYGLLVRERGEGISVSPLALKLIHPVNDQQMMEARREASLKPRVFLELYSGGFHHCTEDTLANHLIQEGFTHDGARKAAGVFKANDEYSQLGENIITLDTNPQITQVDIRNESNKPAGATEKERQQSAPEGGKVLATYSVPIGANEVKIVFTGDQLHSEDFDALSEYVGLFKRQFERKQKSEPSNQAPPKPAFPEPPFVAQRKSSTGETMVKIIGQPWFENGKWNFQAEGGIVVPADEIFPNLKV
jgi:hypothetical protein